MTIRIALIAYATLTSSLISGAAHATLQGRDLDGSTDSFEAYYDTVLDITWLKDANYAKTSGDNFYGFMSWDNATTWVANLSFTDGVHVYDNWRLPTVNPVNGTSFNYSYSLDGSTDWGYNITSPNSELAYMFYVNLGNPAYFTPAGAVSGCYVSSSDTCLGNTGPFANLQSDGYWSGWEYAPDTTIAGVFGMNDGSQLASSKGIGRYVWAVSPGDVAAVPEAQTYALMLAGLGLIGWRARRRG
jgi:hypothetical protein